MAKRASVRLAGRFRPGTEVRLVKVRDESVLRAEGGKEVGTATVDKDGTVEFKSGVEDGARYFAVGQVNGQHLEVRLTGRVQDDDAVNAQAPVGYDRLRLADGSYVDEPPEQHQDTPKFEVGPAPGQHQVPKGVVQRSDTPRGYAHPVDPEEQTPYRRQEDVPDGTVQMSSTATGKATEIVQSVQRQEETPAGMLQRSDTPFGQAAPIPKGDAVRAQLQKESSQAKESRGEPGRAAAEPMGSHSRIAGAGKVSMPPTVPGSPNPRDVTSGHDAMGQPIYADLAANVGVQPANKPLAAMRGDKPAQDRPDAKPAEPAAPISHDPPQQMEASETEEASTGAGTTKPTGELDLTKSNQSTKAKEK